MILHKKLIVIFNVINRSYDHKFIFWGKQFMRESHLFCKQKINWRVSLKQLEHLLKRVKENERKKSSTNIHLTPY